MQMSELILNKVFRVGGLPMLAPRGGTGRGNTFTVNTVALLQSYFSLALKLVSSQYFLERSTLGDC